MQENWRIKHGEVIKALLEYLNSKSDDYILKGGTSLMMCYNLDRFSEDIDLDSTNHQQIKKIIDEFCEKNNYTYRIAKDTDTVKRYMIHYGNEFKPLKVEISYRKKVISTEEIQNINGIHVYDINSICMMKVNAYNSRDKIRDLYDLAFICNNYFDALSPVVKDLLRHGMEYKGLEQFDYLVHSQSDELINNDKLAEDFLLMYEKLDLLIGKEEKATLSVLETITEPSLNGKISSAERRISAQQNNESPEKSPKEIKKKDKEIER